MRRAAVLAAAAAWLLGCGGAGLPWAQESQRAAIPVYVLATEGLEPPAVATGEAVVRPSHVFVLDDVAAKNAEGAGFFVTVAADSAVAVSFRIMTPELGVNALLARVAGPADDDEAGLASEPRPFSAGARERLMGGEGVFWHAGSNGDLEHRFGVLVPMLLLGRSSTLEVFTSAGDDGTPLASARLELVRGFFYLAIIGDSIQWGNGLEERDKMSTLVTAVIEAETQRRVIMQRYAQSGATIVPDEDDRPCAVGCSGEVPIITTAITQQVDQLRRPDLIELVLMDGCINDVGIGRILNPFTPEETLVELTREFCDEEMGVLLQKVAAAAPQARVVVTGYYPIVGLDGDLFALRTWATALGFASAADDESLTAILNRRSVTFRDQAHAGLAAAIGRVNGAQAGSAVVFADPGFESPNAVFGSDAWLWSLVPESEFLEDLQLGLDLFPEDPLQGLRLEECVDAYGLAAALPCIYSSIAHPNVRGAQAYADAIVAALRELGVLPATAGGASAAP